MAELVVNEERSEKRQFDTKSQGVQQRMNSLHILYYIFIYGSRGILISELLTLSNLLCSLHGYTLCGNAKKPI